MSKKECQSPSNSHILQRALSATEGYEVRGGPDGQMVLAVIENKPPELILLDVKVPGMDGFEVYRQITTGRPVHGWQH